MPTRVTGSASNRQPWRFIIVEDAERRDKLAHAVYEQSNLRGAQLVIAIVGTRPFDGKEFMRKRIDMLWPHQVASRWRIVNWCEDDQKILFEGVDEYDQPDGVTVAMPYMGIYQIKGGRIWRARDYFDMAGYLGMTKGDANPWLLKVVETMTERP